MAAVVHFEIHAENPERAITFYSSVFDWEIKQMGNEEYWLISAKKEGEGIDGAILKRRSEPPASGQPVNAYVCTIDVSSVDDYVQKVTSNGGSIAIAKVEIPQIGWLVYCKDTEGNIFGMLQAMQPVK